MREILKDTQLTKTLPDHGFSQTAYLVHISDVKVDIFTQFYAEHSKQLSAFSHLIKKTARETSLLKLTHSPEAVVSRDEQVFIKHRTVLDTEIFL